MQPTAIQLAMRDPAMAALMGATPSDFGDEYGAEFGDEGAEFGDEGAEFGSTAMFAGHSKHPKHKHGHHQLHPEHQALLEREHHRKMRTHKREMLLEPNKGSSVKIEGYDFSLPQQFPSTITFGTPAGMSATLQPSVTIRPVKMFTNAPSPFFCTLNTVQVANVSALVGGISDAFAYNMGSNNGSLSNLPTLSPSNRASWSGTYTGATPTGFPLAFVGTFILTFQGPATIVA